MPSDQGRDEVLDRLESLLKSVRGWRSSTPKLRNLNDSYRQLHTVKGLVLRDGESEIDEQVHLLESVFDGLRCGRLDPNDSCSDLLVLALSGLRDKLSGNGPTADCLHELVELLARQREEEALPAGLELDDELLRQLSRFETTWLVRAVRDGKTVVTMDAELPLMELDVALPRLQDRIRNAGGEVIASIPGRVADPPHQIAFVLITEWPTGELPADLSETLQVRAVRVLAADDTSENEEVHPQVRLAVEQVDQLLQLLSELRQARGPLAKPLQGAIGRLPPSEAAVLRQRLRVENRLFFRVLHQALQLRFVKLDVLAERLREAFRDVVRVAGVEAELEIDMGEAQLDRNLVDALYGPLLHLIRNAVDHGIAGSDVAVGRRGVVRIVANQRGTGVQIAVSDDGRGVDLESIRVRAEHAGLIRDRESASEEELLACLFEPGFSSRDEAGKLSGRGVGLDAVRSFVARVGGTISVSTETGRGSKFTLVVPATVGLQDVQLARVGGHLIGVPVAVIDRVEQLSGQWVLNVHFGALGARLTVDRILEQRSVAVHPLGATAHATPGVLGAFEHGVSSEVGFLVDPVAFEASGVTVHREGEATGG